MIRAATDQSGRMSLDLSDAAIAFIDRDWIPLGADRRVPAIVFSGDGTVYWDGAELESSGKDRERTASGLIAAAAAEAAEAVAGLVTVEVLGNGALANEIRRRVGTSALGGDQPGAGSPAAVVDVTGDPHSLVAATERLVSGGTLVMVGEPLERPLEMNLYKHVHVRGLRVVGVGRPGSARVYDGEAELPPARKVRPQEQLPDAAWYRLER